MDLPKSACHNCRVAHKGCSRSGPPCARCIEFGIESTCVYRPHPPPNTNFVKKNTPNKIKKPPKPKINNNNDSNMERSSVPKQRLKSSALSNSPNTTPKLLRERERFRSSDRMERNLIQETRVHREAFFLLDNFADSEKSSYPPLPYGANTQLNVVLEETDPNLLREIEEEGIVSLLTWKEEDIIYLTH
jgi:hypothetical protein